MKAHTNLSSTRQIPWLWTRVVQTRRQRLVRSLNEFPCFPVSIPVPVSVPAFPCFPVARMIVERAGNDFSLQDGTGKVIVKVTMCLHRLQSRISVPITQILRVGGACFYLLLHRQYRQGMQFYKWYVFWLLFSFAKEGISNLVEMRSALRALLRNGDRSTIQMQGLISL